MQISQLERTLMSGGYICDIYSHRGVYGFVVYTENDDVKALASWDFGYYGIASAESAALACILRRALGVSVKDYSTVFNDSKCDCEDSEC